MQKHRITHDRKLALQATVGGLIGAFLAVLLGVPLGLLAALSVATIAYSCRWRIKLERKPREDSTPNA